MTNSYWLLLFCLMARAPIQTRTRALSLAHLTWSQACEKLANYLFVGELFLNISRAGENRRTDELTFEFQMIFGLWLDSIRGSIRFTRHLWSSVVYVTKKLLLRQLDASFTVNHSHLLRRPTNAVVSTQHRHLKTPTRDGPRQSKCKTYT